MRDQLSSYWHICEARYYWDAITRSERENGAYEYVDDEDKRTGCDCCAGICPCGEWEMAGNV